MAELTKNQNNYNNPGTDEELAKEEQNAMELAAEQEAYSAKMAARELYDQGMAFSPPSIFLSKWGFLLALATINDVVDLLDLTGFGAIISWVVSLGLTAVILLIIWFTDGNTKRAQQYTQNIAGTAAEIQIASQVRSLESRIEGLAGRTSERLKKIPGFKNVKLRKTARKNPLARALVGSALESVPFLGALNLITVWVFFAYLAEKHTVEAAREAAKSILESTG